MNAIVQRTASTAVGALKSLKAGIQNVQQTMVRRSSDPYLRLLKDGDWVYGQESISVETGSLWAANPLSIEHGWTAWDRSPKADNSNGPLGEVMVSQSLPLPGKDTLKDVGHDWEYQMSIVFMCLNGTDKGEQVLYKANSVGATKAMDELIKAISRQLDADESKPVPVVQFDSSTYNHKTYGRVYEPVLTIKDWLPLLDDMPEVAEPETPAQPEPAASTKARTRSVPATKATEAPAEEDEIAKLERLIAEKKAKADAAAKAAADPDMTRALTPEELAAARKAQLMAELAALDGGAGQAAQTAPAAQAEAPAANAPLRRRRA